MAWQTFSTIGYLKEGGGYADLQYDDSSTGTNRSCRLRVHNNNADIYCRNITIDGTVVASEILISSGGGSVNLWSGPLSGGKNHSFSFYNPWFSGGATVSGSGNLPAAYSAPAKPSGTVDDIGTTDIVPGKAEVTITENNWGIGSGRYLVIASKNSGHDANQEWGRYEQSSSFSAKTFSFTNYLTANSSADNTVPSVWYPEAYNGQQSSFDDAKYITSPSAPIVHVSPTSNRGELDISMSVNYSGGTANSATDDTALMRMWKTKCMVDDVEGQDTEATTIIPVEEPASKTCEQTLSTRAWENSRTIYVTATNQWGGWSSVSGVITPPQDVSISCTQSTPTTLTLECSAESMGDTDDTMQWDPITYKDCYFCYSTDPDAFNTEDYDSTDYTDGYSVTIEGLTRNTTYYCQAVMFNNYGLIGKSGIVAFKTSNAYEPVFSVNIGALPNNEVGFKANVNITKAGGLQPDSDTITSVKLLANSVENPQPDYKLISEDKTGKKQISLESIGVLDPSAQLPSQFQRLQYIESTVEQYIDTGVSGGSSSGLEIEFNTLGVHQVIACYFAGDINSQSGTSINIYSVDDYVLIGGGSLTPCYMFDNTDSIHTVSYNMDNDNILKVDNDIVGKLEDYSWGSLPYYIWSGNLGSSSSEMLQSVMRLYSLKMITDGEPVRDYIPARAKVASRNLFNKKDVTMGYRFSSNGSLTADSNFVASDFMSVSSGVTYYFERLTSNESVCEYDKNKKFIKRTQTVGVTNVTTTSTTSFVRIAIRKEKLDTRQFEEGSTTPYEPYYEAGEVGLYDLVNNRFYVNAGTEDFLAGPPTNNTWGDCNIRVEVTNGTGITTHMDTILRAPSDLSLTDIGADGNRLWAVPHYTINNGNLLYYYLYVENREGECEWGPEYTTQSTNPVHSYMRLEFDTDYEPCLIVYDTYGLRNSAPDGKYYHTDPENITHFVSGGITKEISMSTMSSKTGIGKKSIGRIYHVKNNSIGSVLQPGVAYRNLKLFFPSGNAYHASAAEHNYIVFRDLSNDQTLYLGDISTPLNGEVFGIFDNSSRNLVEGFCANGVWQRTAPYEFPDNIEIIEVGSFGNRGLNISPFFSQITCKFDSEE